MPSNGFEKEILIKIEEYIKESNRFTDSCNGLSEDPNTLIDNFTMIVNLWTSMNKIKKEIIHLSMKTEDLSIIDLIETLKDFHYTCEETYTSVKQYKDQVLLEVYKTHSNKLERIQKDIIKLMKKNEHQEIEFNNIVERIVFETKKTEETFENIKTEAKITKDEIKESQSKNIEIMALLVSVIGLIIANVGLFNQETINLISVVIINLSMLLAISTIFIFIFQIIFKHSDNQEQEEKYLRIKRIPMHMFWIICVIILFTVVFGVTI